MTDREYVIRSLKYLHDRETWKEGPLVWDDQAAERREITADALALLREQESVAPRYKGPCDLCKFDLEDGDYLYQHTSSDHAIVYEEVVVHYCPVCGRKLKGE